MYGHLSAVTADEAESKSWGGYVAALRDQILTSKAAAVASYNALKQVRQKLGLPFMAGAAGEAGGGDAGAWSQDLEQQAVDVTAMAALCVNAANDVLARKRRLMWDDKQNDFAIEGLPGDVVRLQKAENGVPVLVDSSGQVTHVTGQVGNPLVVFGVIAALAVVQALALLLLVDQALKTLQVVAEQRTQRTLADAAKKHADLVEQGKATPAEAKSLNDSIYGGATGLAKAAGETKKPFGFESETLVKLGYVALGLGVLYVIVKFMALRTPSGGGAPVPALPLALNPHREPVDEHAAVELKLYIDNDNRYAIMGGGQGRYISKNLWRKWQKGTYDSSKAPKAWSYVVESAAKAYAKEFSEPRDWSTIFNPATRAHVARELALDWEAFAEDGTFDRYAPAA